MTRSLMVFTLLLFLTAGCFVRYVPVESPMPVIKIPTRPAVAAEPEFSEREVVIVNYARQLEAVVVEYNKTAVEHNENIQKVE